MRKTRLTRKSSLTRSPMKRGRKRSAAEFARVYGGEERILWMQRQRCVVTGEWPCVTVHVKTGGMGRKADARWTVPMIPHKHDELHRIGIRSFEAKYHVNLECLAIATQERWEREQAIAVLHTTDPLCVRCQASFRERGAFCGSCAELNRQERPAKARKQSPRDAA